MLSSEEPIYYFRRRPTNVSRMRLAETNIPSDVIASESRTPMWESTPDPYSPAWDPSSRTPYRDHDSHAGPSPDETRRSRIASPSRDSPRQNTQTAEDSIVSQPSGELLYRLLDCILWLICSTSYPK